MSIEWDLTQFNFQSFADDQQNYLFFKPNNMKPLESVRSLLKHVSQILCKWMRTNKLKLNDDETEFALFGTRQQMEKLKENDTFEIKIGSENQ